MDASGDVVFDGGYAVWFTDDLIHSLWLIFAGMLLFSAGFFAAPPLPAAGSAPAQNALKARPPAISVQLLSGVKYCRDAGWCFWHNYGWNGVGAFIALMLVIVCWSGRVCIIVCTPEKISPDEVNTRPDLLPAQTNVNSHPK